MSQKEKEIIERIGQKLANLPEEVAKKFEFMMDGAAMMAEHKKEAEKDA